MKTYTIKYLWFKIIKTVEVSAYNYMGALVEFERVVEVGRRWILKVIG